MQLRRKHSPQRAWSIEKVKPENIIGLVLKVHLEIYNWLRQVSCYFLLLQKRTKKRARQKITTLLPVAAMWYDSAKW
jgi:hypothetical protein